MNAQRYQAELTILRRKLTNNLYKFMDLDTPNAHVVMAARTNRGNIYTLYIPLDGFPQKLPKVFVTKMLHAKNGTPLDGPSAAMHTLPSENGWTRLCHYGFSSWTANVSLYKIYVKCRLWLEMYELHLQTGNPIEYYLNHQA